MVTVESTRVSDEGDENEIWTWYVHLFTNGYSSNKFSDEEMNSLATHFNAIGKILEEHNNASL